MNDRLTQVEADTVWLKKMQEESRADQKEIVRLLSAMGDKLAGIDKKTPNLWLVVSTVLGFALTMIAVVVGGIIGGLAYLQP